MRCRVVCALDVVTQRSSPNKAFVIVDFPTFGEPTTPTKPARKPAFGASGAVASSSAGCSTPASSIDGGGRVRRVRGRRRRAVRLEYSFDQYRLRAADGQAQRAALVLEVRHAQLGEVSSPRATSQRSRARIAYSARAASRARRAAGQQQEQGEACSHIVWVANGCNRVLKLLCARVKWIVMRRVRVFSTSTRETASLRS